MYRIQTGGIVSNVGGMEMGGTGGIHRHWFAIDGGMYIWRLYFVSNVGGMEKGNTGSIHRLHTPRRPCPIIYFLVCLVCNRWQHVYWEAILR